MRNQPTMRWEYLSYNCKFPGKGAPIGPVWVKCPFLVQSPVTEAVGHMCVTNMAIMFVNMAYPCGLVGGQNLPEIAKGHYPPAGLLPRRMESRSISRAKESTWTTVCRQEGVPLSPRDNRCPQQGRRSVPGWAVRSSRLLLPSPSATFQSKESPAGSSPGIPR